MHILLDFQKGQKDAKFLQLTENVDMKCEKTASSSRYGLMKMIIEKTIISGH